jgi:protein SCO1
VFVSVDPERDTPARLGEYVPVFGPEFYGVHIPLDELEPIKGAYGVVAEKNYYDEEDSAAGYSVDHTARVYLIDPAGNLRLSFGYGTPVEDIGSDIEYILQQ